MYKLVRLSFVIALVAALCSERPVVEAQVGSPRRVNIPYSSDQVDWAETAIFWFGSNDQGIPSRNYVDVRLAYTPTALQVRFTVVDYYLWSIDFTQTNDLAAYDAAAIYLDTGFDRAAAPQLDDYVFLVGARHWPNENAVQYHRQARGTGAGWDTSWSGEWTDYEAMQWSDSGPNDNGGNIDYGWFAILTIPWETLGRSGPPSENTLWGLGAQLYDRDDSAASGWVDPEHWPETFDADSPVTWGELHFGYADYEPPPAVPEGTTVIRASSPTDNTVEDAWMGGGGTCGGGHNGGSEVNHGDEADLFVGTETAPTHFPCFSKSYLRFSLDAIPPGKVILSAALELHLWGNAGDPGQAQPSWVHLLTVSDPWDEMAIHWNNAPLAQENVSATWVYPYSRPGDIQWPGDSYEWDATKAVAKAYDADRPVSLVIYGSDTAQHSSKYLLSSESYYVEGRPTLTVVWGQGILLHKAAQVEPLPGESVLGLGGTITYTLQAIGSGQAITVTDALPAEVSHPLTYTSSSGAVSYDSTTRTLLWVGTPDNGQVATIDYPVTVIQDGTYLLVNAAHLTTEDGHTYMASSMVLVEPYQAFLPLVLREW